MNCNCSTVGELMEMSRKENEIFPVIRKTFPKMMSAELISEQPLMPTEFKKPFEQLAINGGLIHDFVRGWIFTPYRLVRNEVQYPKEIDTIFYFIIVKELEELDRAETEEDFQYVKDKWQKMIDDFNNKD